jgi:hypothetical protein
VGWFSQSTERKAGLRFSFSRTMDSRQREAVADFVGITGTDPSFAKSFLEVWRALICTAQENAHQWAVELCVVAVSSVPCLSRGSGLPLDRVGTRVACMRLC